MQTAPGLSDNRTPEHRLPGRGHMTRIAGALAMGLLFLSISPALRAKLLDDLAALADEVSRCGVFAYVGLAIVILGGALIVLTSGPEPQASAQDYVVVKRKGSRARAGDSRQS